MSKITFAQAAEQIAKRKAKLEAQYEKGDAWSKKALEPQLQKLDNKLAQLEQMNEQARVEKFNAGMNRFMKKYGGYLPKAETGLRPGSTQYSKLLELAYPDNPTAGMPTPEYFQTITDRADYSGLQMTSKTSSPIQGGASQIFPEKIKPKTPIQVGNYNEKPVMGIGTPSELETAAQLAHPLYNIYQGLRPIDKTTPVQNPYERESLQNLRNYRYNINPQLADIDASRAYLRTQARDASGGSGRAYMRYALGAEGLAGRQTAQAYNAKEQAEFAAKQQLSGALDTFGRQRVQAQNIANESNKAAYAQRSKYMQTGLEDLSMYTQRNIIDRRMRHGDSELGRISKPVYGDELNQIPPQPSWFSHLQDLYKYQMNRRQLRQQSNI